MHSPHIPNTYTKEMQNHAHPVSRRASDAAMTSYGFGGGDGSSGVLLANREASVVRSEVNA